MAPKYGMVAGIDLLTAEGRMEGMTRAASLRDFAETERDETRKAAFLVEADALESWLRSYYSTSKYGDALAEAADAIVNEGFAEDQTGSVNESGHYALVIVSDAPMSQRYVILATDSQGFVDVRFTSADRASALRQWADIEEETRVEDVEAEDVEAPQRAYVVQAVRRTYTAEGYTLTQVPTFYLLANVQGIVSVEQAERVARDVLAMPADDDSLGAVTVVETSL